MNKVTKEQYEFALARIEELLPLVDDNTPANDKNAVELTVMSDIVIAYEKEPLYQTNFSIRLFLLYHTNALRLCVNLHNLWFHRKLSAFYVILFSYVVHLIQKY